MTAPAGSSYGSGKVGQGAVLGSGQYMYVDGMKATLGTYAKVTIAFWLLEPGNAPGLSVLDVGNRAAAPYGGVTLGLTNTSVSLCVSSTTNAFLAGSCVGFTAPSANSWHHWLLRYDGSGTGAGQGGPLQVYVDDVLVHTRANDVNNNPVFSSGIPDRLYVGMANSQVDDVQIYDQVLTQAQQCTAILLGSWTGASCTLP